MAAFGKIKKSLFKNFFLCLLSQKVFGHYLSVFSPHCSFFPLFPPMINQIHDYVQVWHSNENKINHVYFQKKKWCEKSNLVNLMHTNVGKFALTFGSFKSTIAFRIEDQSITISKMLAFRPSKDLQFIQMFLLYKGRSSSVSKNLKSPLEGVYIIINPHPLTYDHETLHHNDWKLLKMSHLNFGIFHQFLSY